MLLVCTPQVFHATAPQPEGYSEVAVPTEIGNNGVLFQPIHHDDVTKIEVFWFGSGALNEILYRVCPYTRSPSQAPSNEPTINSMPVNIEEAVDCENGGTFVAGSLTGTLGGIVVDGDASEWTGLETTLDMHEGGNPANPVVSQAHIEVDCSINQWYIWVEALDPIYNSIDTAVPADHYISVNGNILITGQAATGQPNDPWQWIQASPTYTTGWEATTVAPQYPDLLRIQTMVDTASNGLVEASVDLTICVCGNFVPSERTFFFFPCCWLVLCAVSLLCDDASAHSLVCESTPSLLLLQNLRTARPNNRMNSQASTHTHTHRQRDAHLLLFVPRCLVANPPFAMQLPLSCAECPPGEEYPVFGLSGSIGEDPIDYL